MSKQDWSINTSFWSVIPPQVALELRVFPIGFEGTTLVLLTDCLSAEPTTRLEVEEMVRNNLGRPIRLVSVEDYEDTELYFDQLLEEFYDPEEMPQVVSVPITRGLETVVVIDSNRVRAKAIGRDHEEEGFSVKYASTLKKGLRIIQSLGGMVKTVRVARDLVGGYEEAVRAIKSIHETTSCEPINCETTSRKAAAL
jgi:hypothetical protein